MMSRGAASAVDQPEACGSGGPEAAEAPPSCSAQPPPHAPAPAQHQAGPASAAHTLQPARDSAGPGAGAPEAAGGSGPLQAGGSSSFLVHLQARMAERRSANAAACTSSSSPKPASALGAAPGALPAAEARAVQHLRSLTPGPTRAPAPSPSSPPSPTLLSAHERRRRLQDQQNAAAMVAAGEQVASPQKRRRSAGSRLVASPAASNGASGGAASSTTSTPALNPRVALWVPPASPYSLLEECLYADPWRLLVACMLLNKTSGTQVRLVLGRLFSWYPTPEALAALVPELSPGAASSPQLHEADSQAGAPAPARTASNSPAGAPPSPSSPAALPHPGGRSLADLQQLLRPLGLHRKRALALARFSHEYLARPWTDPRDLHGIGQYAADAYSIFCRGRWRDVQPEDKDLRRYRDWLESTDGAGAGLQREALEDVLSTSAAPSSPH